jgi:putative aldouronate transport system substrate-binding protein
MKKVSKIITLITALLVISSLFSGFSKTASAPTIVNGVDVSNPVELTMYLVGDAVPDAEKVYEAVNKKLKEDINTTVKVKYLSWADWDKKYALIFAAGEDFDCIYTADWAYYADQATKHGFMEIKPDMVKKYMPEYYAQIPGDFWNQLKINGKIYMIPYLNKQVEGCLIPMVRGDLRVKYHLPLIKTINDFNNYLTTIVKNEKGMIGFDGSALNLAALMNSVYYDQPNNLFSYQTVPVFTTKLNDLSGKVNYALDDPAYLNMLLTAKKLSDAGVWSKGILASKNDNGKAFNAGKSAFHYNNAEGVIQEYNTVNTDNPKWNLEIADLSSDKLHQSSSATRSGMAINANSKHADRVMLMLNLFGTHKDYYDLTTYGIVGVHYTPVGNNKMTSTPLGITNYPPKANCPWGWERKDFMRFPTNVPEAAISLESNWIKNGLSSKTPIVSFNFVDTNLKTEVAACNNIYQQRGYILLAGLSDNPKADLDKLKSDLKKAGIEKIQAELQKQVIQFMKSTR